MICNINGGISLMLQVMTLFTNARNAVQPNSPFAFSDAHVLDGASWSFFLRAQS